METEPYNLQSPEQIAKDYGGNKQRIAEAMQMGLLDPTAGTLAGMFIDRMRNAAQAEAAPQQSVAQQVFAPPMPVAPGAGLAGTPQAAAMQSQMPPMPGGAPGGAPMGPPPAGLAAAPMPAPGMAAGGLTTLPLPHDMFDEPSYGGYRGGGLVAFAAGSPGELVDEEEDKLGGDITAMTGDLAATPATADPAMDPEAGSILVEAPLARPKYKQGEMFVAPLNLGGFEDTAEANLEKYNRDLAPRETARAQQYQEYLDRMLSPEEQRARRQEDMWAALGQIGARMATTPGSLLQAVSTGIGEALPGIRSAAAERRGEERTARQALLAEERTGNQEVMARANIALDMLNSYNTLEQAFQSRNFEAMLTRLGIDADLVKANIMAGAGIREALIGAASNREVAGIQLRSERERTNQQIRQTIEDMIGPGGELAGPAAQARQAGTLPQFRQQLFRRYGGYGSYGASADDPLGIR